jgi:hypothetical protein
VFLNDTQNELTVVLVEVLPDEVVVLLLVLLEEEEEDEDEPPAETVIAEVPLLSYPSVETIW